ncbi:MAG: hypothetical protein GTO45_38405, partial [Candidatus Aminicenantes bacterium]|nr:hypothetical protein [Candidatus Aminicenantes bacterium]NIM84496.1 hypothetical protein [Candidatus Aminicenantes bacterium]NIN24017.1 hypothetical protein [Candidatus Aminicenantes bacterium]NIN47731.1 hypothetical protein [Candidatus Aminicenantes bacterium]NIN90661.1 hypothetical protein [Candidatus Aminicenantes bacterium]
MKIKRLVFLSFLVLVGVFFTAASNPGNMKAKVKALEDQPSTKVMIDLDFGRTPLYFIPNKGHMNGKALFYA